MMEKELEEEKSLMFLHGVPEHWHHLLGWHSALGIKYVKCHICHCSGGD
jgi:hypothetical protein